MPPPSARYWLLTWTTYGTWLPGDKRGFVSPVPAADGRWKIHNKPGTPCDHDMLALKQLAQARMIGPLVVLQKPQAIALLKQFQETANFRGWQLLAAALMHNHVHLLVGVPGDPEPETMLRDFKAYGSGALNRQWSKPTNGTWWTRSGSRRKKQGRAVPVAVRYIARQRNPLLVWVHSEWERVLSE